MTLIQAWKEACLFLRPESLKQFGMITIKTVTDIYRKINHPPLAARGNWIIASILVLLIGSTNVIKYFHLYFIQEILLNSMRSFAFFVFILAIRPSVGQKVVAYYREYMYRFWYILVGMIICGIAYVYVIPFTLLWTLFFMLFAFDSIGTGRALINAAKNSTIMMAFNLPVIAVLWVGIGMINALLYKLILFAIGYFGGLPVVAFLYLVFIPVEVALVTNMYIKLLHAQPSLYFKQPE